MVSALTDEGGIIFYQSPHYVTSGSQLGDCSALLWSGGKAKIETTFKGENGALIWMPAKGKDHLGIGKEVVQNLH